jgi:hypothetical protein
MVCGKKIARAKKAAKLTTTKTRPLGVSERPRVAAFCRVVSGLYRSPPAGLIFSLNHRPYSAIDAFLVCIIFWHSLCKWNQTLAHIFSNAVASLQQ